MLVLVIRTLILYLLVVVAMRIMGKRQIGELQPSELVIAIMISDLASVPMQAIDIPLLAGVVPVLTLLVWEVVMSFVSLKSRRMRRYISGEPSIVVYNGHINENELKKLRFNLNDLMEQLRISGCPDVSNVAAAVLETNGQLSVLEKKQNTASGLPYFIVSDGEINETELKRAGKNKKWLKDQLDCPVSDVFSALLVSSAGLSVVCFISSFFFAFSITASMAF